METKLKPYSEALFNALEQLDSQPSYSKEGVTLDNLKAGIESYFVSQVINDGYIIEIPSGSARHKLTVDGVALLNQMRLNKSLERAEKSSNRNFWIQLVLSAVTGLAAIFIGIIPFFKSI